ncbi:MAG: hypothetical protein V2A64_01170 [Candidatus Omnitrophota bacterium]
MLIIGLVFCTITAYLAKRKGYNPVFWFFSAGIVGLCVLAFLPHINKSNLTEEEKNKKARTGNKIGGVISVITIALIIFDVFVLFPIKHKQFTALRIGAKKAVCEAQAGKINLALDEYYKWHIMNFNDGPHKPASIHDTELINRFLNGELPEHPLGRDWNNYYNPDQPTELINGQVQGPIDVNNACDF